MPGPQNIGSAQIGGKDDVEAGKIESAIHAAGHSRGVEDSKENIRHFGAGLFNFIGQQNAFLMLDQNIAKPPESSGVVANEFRQRILSFEFGHIETDRFAPVVESVRQNAGCFGFSDAGRSEEEEGTFGAMRRGEIRFANGHALKDGGKDVVLAANRFAETAFQMSEAI
jgi:hypothetical protein